MSKTGVIIANTGSPSSPELEAVSEYLREFLMDPRIRPMPKPIWRMILETQILPRRSKASSEKYRKIWTDEGSPLVSYMSSLSRKLNERLPDMEVRYAMSYGEPSVGSALKDLIASGCGEVVVIPLYPQSAFSTAQVVFDKAHIVVEQMDGDTQISEVDGYSHVPEYLDAISESIRNAGFREGDRILFAFHSIPIRDIENGDTYDEQVRKTVEGIVERLGISEGEWEMGFQSRFDKNRKWLGPSNKVAMRRLLGLSDDGDDYAVVSEDLPGFREDLPNDGSSVADDSYESVSEADSRIFVICPNFSIDCLETFYDIGIELKGYYTSLFNPKDDGEAESTASRFVYVPCLNDSEAHVRVLESVIDDALDHM